MADAPSTPTILLEDNSTDVDWLAPIVIPWTAMVDPTSRTTTTEEKNIVTFVSQNDWLSFANFQNSNRNQDQMAWSASDRANITLSMDANRTRRNYRGGEVGDSRSCLRWAFGRMSSRILVTRLSGASSRTRAHGSRSTTHP